MQLLLPIGTDSLNQTVNIDLSDAGHLYVSYTNNEQATFYFNQFAEAALSHPEVFVSLGFSRSGKLLDDRLLSQVVNLCKPLFHPGDPSSCVSGSKRAFIHSLYKELDYRRKNNGFHSQLVIMIDDCLEFLSSVTRRSGEKFIEILHDGPAVGMHLIMASTWSYKTMASQLIHNAGNVPCAEMVVSGENYIYLRDRQASNYSRLYPVIEEQPVWVKQASFAQEADASPF